MASTITVPYEHWWENETSVIVITNSNYLLTTSIITIFEEGSILIFIIFLRDRITSLVDDDEDHYIMGYNFHKRKTNKEGKLYKVIAYYPYDILYIIKTWFECMNDWSDSI